MRSLFNLRGWPLPSFVPNLYFRFETDKLLAVKGWLVSQCCCRPPRFKCLKVGKTPCGQDEYECVPDSSGEYRSEWECFNACPQTPPDPECSGCEECVDQQCVGACGPCESCNGDYCAPACSDCEQCIDGACVSACGVCEACVNGICVPMDPCIPPDDKWYCCAEPAPPPETGMPAPPPVLRCQRGPCGRVEDGTWTEDPDLTFGGPYDSPQECGSKCRGHSCLPDGCNGNACIPAADAPQFNSWDECQNACPDTPTTLCESTTVYQWPTTTDVCPCTITGTGAGTHVYKFGIDPDYNGPICVSYINHCGLPIRIQISAPQLSDDGCTVIQKDEIYCDSGWRGAPECWTREDGTKVCDFTAPGGIKGPPKGICKWSRKTRGVGHFFVTVRTHCRAGSNNEEDGWKIVVKCGDCAVIEEDYECCPPPEYDRCVDYYLEASWGGMTMVWYPGTDTGDVGVCSVPAGSPCGPFENGLETADRLGVFRWEYFGRIKSCIIGSWVGTCSPPGNPLVPPAPECFATCECIDLATNEPCGENPESPEWTFTGYIVTVHDPVGGCTYDPAAQVTAFGCASPGHARAYDCCFTGQMSVWKYTCVLAASEKEADGVTPLVSKAATVEEVLYPMPPDFLPDPAPQDSFVPCDGYTPVAPTVTLYFVPPNL